MNKIFELFSYIFYYSFFIWILSWIVILFASYVKLEKYKHFLLFTILVWYIISFPFIRRIYLAINDSKLVLTSFLSSFYIIIVLVLLAFILLLQIIKKNPILMNSKFKKLATNFSNIWLTSIKPITSIEFMEYFIVYTLTIATKYLTNNLKKILFFSLTIYLPKIFVFSFFLYDIYIKKELYWSLKLSFLLLLPLTCKILLDILEIYAKDTFEKISDHFYFVSENLTTKNAEILHINFGLIDCSKLLFKLKPCYTNEFNQERYNLFIENFYEYLRFTNWCNKTKNLKNIISPYVNLILVFFTLFLQINLICFS